MRQLWKDVAKGNQRDFALPGKNRKVDKQLPYAKARQSLM